MLLIYREYAFVIITEKVNWCRCDFDAVSIILLKYKKDHKTKKYNLPKMITWLRIEESYFKSEPYKIEPCRQA